MSPFDPPNSAYQEIATLDPLKLCLLQAKKR